MRRGEDYLPRRAAASVLAALADTRVVVINGARQVGKSTLAEKVLRGSPGGAARYLDDPLTRAAAAADPTAFVRHDGLMLIDEVQRVPDLWLAIKNVVDRDPVPGRFLLTGSARLLGLRDLPDALPGRAETIELWPLSQGEIDGTPDGFVDRAFADGVDLTAFGPRGSTGPGDFSGPATPPAPPRKADYLVRAARGGYPEALRRPTARRRQQLFAGYVADLLSRDIRQVADIERVGEMRRLLSMLAARTAGLLNLSGLARDLGISRSTVSGYVAILETIFLVRLIPAWTAGAAGRATMTPKLMFVDTGLSQHLTGGSVTDARIGSSLENFVLGEISRQLTWSEVSARLYHYRDRDQHEVDAVVEADDGAVVGVEVKASETVRGDDFRGLRILEKRAGSSFKAGFVLYCGEQKLSFGPGLVALPISALWTTSPPSA